MKTIDLISQLEEVLLLQPQAILPPTSNNNNNNNRSMFFGSSSNYTIIPISLQTNFKVAEEEGSPIPSETVRT